MRRDLKGSYAVASFFSSEKDGKPAYLWYDPRLKSSSRPTIDEKLPDGKEDDATTGGFGSGESQLDSRSAVLYLTLSARANCQISEVPRSRDTVEKCTYDWRASCEVEATAGDAALLHVVGNGEDFPAGGSCEHLDRPRVRVVLAAEGIQRRPIRLILVARGDAVDARREADRKPIRGVPHGAVQRRDHNWGGGGGLPLRCEQLQLEVAFLRVLNDVLLKQVRKLTARLETALMGSMA